MSITIESIKQKNAEHGEKYFSEDTMQYFRSIVYEDVIATPTGAFFITSEQQDPKSPRLFTIRFANDVGHIETFSKFQEFATFEAAREAMNFCASVVNKAHIEKEKTEQQIQDENQRIMAQIHPSLNSPSHSELQLGRVTIYFSYDSIIGIRTEGETIVSENCWSTTTGKYINQIDPIKSHRLKRADFEAKVAEVFKTKLNIQ